MTPCIDPILTRMPSSRPRRFFLALLSIPVLFLFLLFLASRRPISDLFSTGANLPDEIFGLLHFVTSPSEAGRVLTAVGDPPREAAGEITQETEVQLGGAVVPENPVDMSWYALGSIALASERTRGRRPGKSPSTEWEERLKVLREAYPLVVFSKVLDVREF